MDSPGKEGFLRSHSIASVLPRTGAQVTGFTDLHGLAEQPVRAGTSSHVAPRTWRALGSSEDAPPDGSQGKHLPSLRQAFCAGVFMALSLAAGLDRRASDHPAGLGLGFKPGSPGVVVGAGAHSSSGPFCFLWATRTSLATLGRGRQGQRVTASRPPGDRCWLQRSRPAASGKKLFNEGCSSSDLEGTRRSGSSTRSTQQQSGTDQTGI